MRIYALAIFFQLALTLLRIAWWKKFHHPWKIKEEKCRAENKKNFTPSRLSWMNELGLKRVSWKIDKWKRREREVKMDQVGGNFARQRNVFHFKNCELISLVSLVKFRAKDWWSCIELAYNWKWNLTPRKEFKENNNSRDQNTPWIIN